MKTVENPLAFPNTGNSSWSMQPSEGMTLRDWFAGQALGAMNLSNLGAHPQGVLTTAAVASAYAYADAMLATRLTAPTSALDHEGK